MYFVDLFSGAGGLALGIERAGFRNCAVLEIDKYASATLLKNRPKWNVINADIKNITSLSDVDIRQKFNIEGELDLLTGGAPCQSFSYAGKSLGLNDTRGTLFYHYAKCLTVLKPKVFLFENVRGMLTHDNGKTFQIILNVFKSTGYNVVYKIVNAWDYDVPQKRERLIVVGVRKDLNKEYTYPDIIDKRPVLKDVLPAPASQGIAYSQKKRDIIKLVPMGGNWKDLPDAIAKDYMGAAYNSSGGKTGYLKRLDLNKPSPTILTSPSQKQTDRCHPIDDRPLTVRETARIQTFPDEWEFVGSVASQYKQIGNAVPVNLAYHLGISIKKMLLNP